MAQRQLRIHDNTLHTHSWRTKNASTICVQLHILPVDNYIDLILNLTKPTSHYSTQDMCVRYEIPVDLQEDFGQSFERVKNYCRLPARSDQAKPWCYINDTGYDSEPCDIPLCPPNTRKTLAPISSCALLLTL